MARLLLLFIAVVAAVLFVHWLMNEDPKLVAAKLRRGALYAGAGLLLVLAMTGRLHWLFAVLGAAVPFVGRLLSLLRFAPLFSQLYAHYQNAQSAKAAGLGASPGGGSDTSHVRSRFLHMTLDHDTYQTESRYAHHSFRYPIWPRPLYCPRAFSPSSFLQLPN